jgi:outer membrane protein assembly factor BamB
MKSFKIYRGIKTLRSWLKFISAIIITISLLFAAEYVSSAYSSTAVQGRKSLAWQMFRNNHLRNGYSQVSGFNKIKLAWKFRGNDEFLSSPAIGPDGTIYVGCDDNFIYAVNPDGTLKWKLKTGYHVISSPAIDNEGNVYVGSEDKFFYGISPNGKIKWKLKTGGFVDSSPLVLQNIIYFGSGDGYLYAVGKNGKMLWRKRANSPIFSSPSADNNGVVYFTGRKGNLCKIGSDGNFNALNAESYSTPLVLENGNVLIGDDNGYVNCIECLSGKGLNKGRGALRWRFETGEKIRASAAVNPSNKRVLIGSFDKNFYCMDEKGKLLWKFPTKGEIESSAALTSDGKAIFGSNDGKIYCLDDNGKLLWSYKTNGDVTSSPAIGPNFIVVGSEDNYLYCLRDIGKR